MEDSVGVEERREQFDAMPHKKARQEVVEGGYVGGGMPGEEGGFLSAMASKIGATMSGSNGSGGEVSATMAAGGEEGKMDGNGGQGEEGGFLSAMASKIGAAMSGANGGSGVDGGGNAAVASASPPASGAMETEEVKGDEAGEQAWILSTMASKIGMAMSGTNGDVSHGSSGDNAKTSNGEAVRGNNGEEKNGEQASGGGLLSAVASKIGAAVSGANGNGNHSGENGAKASTGDAGHGSKGEGKEEEKGRDVNGGGIVEQIISNLPSDDQAPDADEASLLIPEQLLENIATCLLFHISPTIQPFNSLFPSQRSSISPTNQHWHEPTNRVDLS